MESILVFASCLQEYVDGLAEGRGVKGPPERVKMRGFVDSMLQEVRSSYRAREEQLASAARSYKKRLQRLTKSHQALLIAYRLAPLMPSMLYFCDLLNVYTTWMVLSSLVRFVCVIRKLDPQPISP